MKSRLYIELNQSTEVDRLVDLEILHGTFDEVKSQIDEVNYGFEEVAIAGFVFLFTTVASGIAWDVIKGGVLKAYKALKSQPSGQPEPARRIHALFEIHLADEELKRREIVLTLKPSELAEVEHYLDQFEMLVSHLNDDELRKAFPLLLVVMDRHLVEDAIESESRG